MQRLFVALTPPPPVADRLLDLMEGLAGVRWTDSDNLHLTLRFIGETPRRQAEDLAASLEDVAFAPFALELSGIGHFSSNGRAQALWAGVRPSPALEDLRFRVESACRRAGLATDGRRFVPHVTLARMRGAPPGLAEWLGRHGTFAAGPWPVRDFGLFESALLPSGAHYTCLARYPG